MDTIIILFLVFRGIPILVIFIMLFTFIHFQRDGEHKDGFQMLVLWGSQARNRTKEDDK